MLFCLLLYLTIRDVSLNYHLVRTKCENPSTITFIMRPPLYYNLLHGWHYEYPAKTYINHVSKEELNVNVGLNKEVRWNWWSELVIVINWASASKSVFKSINIICFLWDWTATDWTLIGTQSIVAVFRNGHIYVWIKLW